MQRNVPHPRTALRTAVAAVLLTTLVATAGCSWLRRGDDLYAAAPADRPLEVPPEMVAPTAAEALPTGPVTASETVAAAAGSRADAPADGAGGGFTVPGTREEVFPRVDEALGTIDGVTVASRAQLLGVFDVNYQDSNFLVRVSDTEAGTRVSAVDPRGMPATGAAAAQLLTQLHAALAGE